MPIAPGATLEATIEHAKRLAAVSRSIAHVHGAKSGHGQFNFQSAGDAKRVHCLQSWPKLKESDLVDALTTANTVPDLLFHDAQKGDQAAAARLVGLARHVAALTARLAEAGNHTVVGGLVDLAETATRSLNRIAGENPAAVAPFASFRLDWPVMGSVRSKPDKDSNALLKQLGLASAWTGIVRKGKRWKLGPAHRIVLDLVVAVYQARPIFSDRHIAHLPALVARLQEPPDDPAKFVWERLSPGTREAMAGYVGGQVDEKGLRMYLVNDLRRMITGSSLELCRDPIHVARRSGKAQSHDLPGSDLPGSNWRKLAEAFPGFLLNPEPAELAPLGEATLQHFTYEHERHWWKAVEGLFHRLHPEPETAPELCALVTAPSHERDLRSRIMQKLREAFEQLIGFRQVDPRSKW
ncbi:MAG: hypothetical protein IH617_09930 [Hydrogenophaga sp.]|nr:hypothetical protein [Hydrogenophaga sp.]